jgi:hypothetical protein
LLGSEYQGLRAKIDQITAPDACRQAMPSFVPRVDLVPDPFAIVGIVDRAGHAKEPTLPEHASATIRSRRIPGFHTGKTAFEYRQNRVVLLDLLGTQLPIEGHGFLLLLLSRHDRC